MSFCSQCLARAEKLSASGSINFRPINPWDHCHHEEKRGCVCQKYNPPFKIYYFIEDNFGVSNTGPSKFCPECGRKLNG